jgi:hypothetical protein
MTASHRTPKEPDGITLGYNERLVRECFLWISPNAFAVLGQWYGWQKVNLPGNVPGLHIAWNDRTRVAVGLALFVAERLWVFGLYGALLLIACLYFDRAESEFGIDLWLGPFFRSLDSGNSTKWPISEEKSFS